jgi:hypothetical protein
VRPSPLLALCGHLQQVVRPSPPLVQHCMPAQHGRIRTHARTTRYSRTRQASVRDTALHGRQQQLATASKVCRRRCIQGSACASTSSRQRTACACTVGHGPCPRWATTWRPHAGRRHASTLGHNMVRAPAAGSGPCPGPPPWPPCAGSTRPPTPASSRSRRTWRDAAHYVSPGDARRRVRRGAVHARLHRRLHRRQLRLHRRRLRRAAHTITMDREGRPLTSPCRP